MSGQQTVNLNTNFGLGGLSFAIAVQLSADVVQSVISSVPVAWASTLTTRTDANTGTLTMTSGSHLITTGAKLDLYWSGGTRRYMTVGTVSGVTVPIDLGSGDNLPIATTVINACVPVKREFFMINANLVLFGAQCDYESQFTFMEADLSTEDYTIHLQPTAANVLTYSYWYSSLGSLPFSGTSVEWVFMSHGDTAAAHVMGVASLS